MGNKKTCCIINIGPHYDYPIYHLMDKEMDCSFYFGDRLPYTIKKFDYYSLKGFKKQLKNRFFSPFYWQTGAIRTLFYDYDNYILTGEPFCLSNWVILVLSKFTKKRIIAWTHGWYGRENKAKGFIKKTFFRLFDHLLVYNEYSLQQLVQQGLSSKKMDCIANSLDSDKVKAVRNRLKPTNIYREHFGNNNPVIIYCGRIQLRKKLDYLVDCIEYLNLHGQPTNLIMVGADNENTGITEIIKKKQLDAIVWMYGPCYEEEIIGELFYNATLCVSPGNVGLTAIHSLSYGCPVITHGDFPYQMPEFEAIKPQITGAFFKRDNKEDLFKTVANWLSVNKDNRETIRQQAYEEIDRKWNVHYQIDVLKKVLS